MHCPIGAFRTVKMSARPRSCASTRSRDRGVLRAIEDDKRPVAAERIVGQPTHIRPFGRVRDGAADKCNDSRHNGRE
jgi:hypothetical protein